MEEIILNNGIRLPFLGLGTYPMNGFTLLKTVVFATKLGYRSFDAAAAYGNERYVGYGIKLTLRDRKFFFITTKLSNTQQRNGNVRASLYKSLKLLKTNYVDLYLMHWPNPDTYLDSWKQMEKLYEEGLVRAIGVCNFHEHHLEKLLSISKVVPAVNQIELHPLLTQKPLIEFCKKYDIRVQAYSPLAKMHEKLVSNQKLSRLSKKYNKSIPQIILRWNYQNGIIGIPKTKNMKRLKENISIFDFDLSYEEIKEIDNLNEGFRVRYNPDNCDFSKL